MNFMSLHQGSLSLTTENVRGLMVPQAPYFMRNYFIYAHHKSSSSALKLFLMLRTQSLRSVFDDHTHNVAVFKIRLNSLN